MPLHRLSLLDLGSERGFTLMEMLVAMVTGVIVTGALLAILEVSLRQQTRITERAQADQTGRTAMSNIVDELHSSCTGFSATAIQAPKETPTSPLAATGAANLWFLSAYGNSSSGEAVLTGVTEHDINWTSTGTSNTGQSLGTLTDYSFPSTGGTSPKWTFPTLSVTEAKAKHTVRVLATDVIAPQVEEEAKKVSTVFQYYKYSTSSHELTPLKSSEIAAAASAQEIAKVTIGFTQAPDSGDTRSGRTAGFSDSVVLRFNPSETGTEAVNIPCE
ncbi:MAG TPA: prepilin-type N-terminal cleavage/methylation domain-containing protein [Solirubrobacteraceae bacterium]|jgi:Tfp pilus assembly protein PilW|nr:prepilin-type N-terminal cleavage/methylation domain-containing protein [Solirubrobacteraceae bacterium]